MVNMLKMMKQAQDMQKNVKKTQAELSKQIVKCSSGKGLVTAFANGDAMLQKLKIDPSVVDPKNISKLEHLVTLAVQGALKSAQEMNAKEMSKITKDMQIPGLSL